MADRPVPDDEELIASLAGRSQKVGEDELRRIFGSDLHEMRTLAMERQAAGTRRGGRPKVYLLHGIMGSQLGISRRFWKDVIWLGLRNVLAGKLMNLRLDADPKVKALGFLPGVYLSMRLQLEIAGFEVVEHAYDWRQEIGGLGAELKKRVEAERDGVMIVAHSMGGLVTRAAFRLGMKGVTKFVMLAVPNHGSLAPIQALRGQYGIARLLAGADLSATAEEQAAKVYATLPGLYQMILHRRLHPASDLLDVSRWPRSGPRPDTGLLELAGKLDSLLARPEDTPEVPWYLIAGIDQQTDVSAAVEGDEFVYQRSTEGDGTVPLASAMLDGVKQTWFAPAGHGFFTHDRGVRKATVDILRSGTTTQLLTERPPARRATQRVTESDLRAVMQAGTRRGGEASQQEQLRIAFGEAGDIAPTPAELPVAGPAGRISRLSQVTIGRKKQRRLEIAFYQGSITEVNARAYVLGTFTGVTPTGAAAAVDELMDGAIAELIGDNMFGSRLGEVFILPLARRQVRAEMGVFVGLGVYDEFKPADSPAAGGRGTGAYLHWQHMPQLEIAAENVARMLARTNVDDFATVLLGGSVAGDFEAAVESLLRGFLRGVEASDPDEGLRRLVICENDPAKYRAISQLIVHLATTPLCEGIEFVLSELDPLPEVSRLRALGLSVAGGPRGPEPAYLLVRSECDPKSPLEQWKFALLGPTSRATLREELHTATKATISGLLAPVDGNLTPGPAAAEKLGADIADKLLPATVREELERMESCPLVVLHNAEASRIPWETLVLKGVTGKRFRPAVEKGMSRRFLAAATVCSRWSTPPSVEGKVNVLLISDPTEDLTGAAREADEIRQTLAVHPRFRIDDQLRGRQATRSDILLKLRTGKYEIVHYCGHAYFDPAHRASCGLICAGNEVLTGDDIQGIAKLPVLLFLNACQSNRTRAADKQRKASPPQTVAEAMLCSGIANFIGTYWPVADAAARRFAGVFYQKLAGGADLGTASLAAREAIRDTADHANYALFGNPATDFAGR